MFRFPAGETLQRILGKAVALVTRYDIEDVCGISQLCVRVRSGLEGAVHAINDLFNAHNEEEWGILMVDASNAFNSINSLAILYSQGVTQRDPLLMLVYAFGTLPLIHSFENPQDDIQIWYADDASACAPLRTGLVSYLERVLHMVTSQSLRKVSLQSV